MTNLIETNYPLSPLQQGMLFHTLAHPNSGIDIEQILITVSAPCKRWAFERAWQTVVTRHPILRTAFQWEEVTEPQQNVFTHIKLPIQYINWSDLSPNERDTELHAFRQADRIRDFDMTQPPLMRLAMFEWGEDCWQCLWTFHHALLDGRSFPLVLGEVFDFYDGYIRGDTLHIPEPRPFADYIQWRTDTDFEQSKSFWQETLAGFTAPTPLDLGKVMVLPRRKNAGIQANLPAPLTAQLTTLATRHNMSLNTLLQGAWGLLLHHYSGEKDVVFGNTRACRHFPLEGSFDMVGLFINTLPIRLTLTPDTPLLDYLQGLRQQHLTLRDHEHTPLPSIQAWSGITAGESLFESLVVFENQLLNNTMQARGAQWQNRQFEYEGQTNFPLALIAYGGEQLLLRLEYNAYRFDKNAIERMLGHLQTLLAGFVNNVHTPALQIPYLTNNERQQLLFDWNPAWDGVVSDHTIHGRFAAQAAKTPRAIAVVYEQESYTYQQLNDHANQVAHSLIEMGVTPNTLVGLCVQRSLNLVVGILGILKAGGAYLPLDPTTPADRMAFMLSDSGVKIVVTDAESPQFADHATLLLTSAPLPRVTPSPLPFVAPTTTAYVIYTSGSTGKPKGVLVTHANVTRLFDATDHWYNFNEKDVWTLFHSFAFDFSVWEIWGALFYGGKLVVVPYLTSRSPEAFLQLLADEQVTVLNQTPSAFRSLVLADAENPHPSPLPEGESWGEGFLSVRTIIFGGEALDLPSLAPWFDRHGDQKPQLVNMYGITETTVHVSYRPLTRADISAGQGSVIGTAIPDLQLYILNEFRQPVPIGVAGEIYVGGNGVASGYLNRPELTAERFIENPFDGVTTLYKTGDVARFLPNRDIEFIGRADSQVKIRGFRIELGEIEAAIRAVAGVQDVIVLALTLDGEKHLVAYLIASNGFDLGMVRTELAEKLPAYMLPSFYQILDSFPLNHNGKLNTKALPQPTQNTHHESRTTNHAPLSTTEQTIIQVWLSILPISHITSDDNFFHIGGNSLSVVKMVGQLRPHFATKVAVHDIFNYPTVRSLANYLSSEADDSPVRQAIDSRAEKRQAAMAARKKQRVKIR